MNNKVIAAVAVMAIIVGFFAMKATAWGWGNGNHMMGYEMLNASTYDTNANQLYRGEIRAIQKEIAIDRAELSALVGGTNPDSQRARELSEGIATKQLTLSDKYRASGYGNSGRWHGNHMMGSGMMNGGYGCS